jgi:7-cyano-7-deazaguanine synthase in queuosine biosynthesis
MNLIKFKELNLSGINLKIYEGPIGISCSGGVDSSLLLYFLMKYSKNKIYIFSTGNKARQFKNITVTNNVIQKCIELTGNMNIEHHSTFCDHQTLSNIFDKLDYYRKNKLINIFYTGITANPPKHITDTFIEEVSEVDRDPTIMREVLHNNNKAYTPWINIDKKKLAQIYKEYNLIDSLFVHTRSCEWETQNVQDPKLGHCGICWWCQERAWGFPN